MKKIKEIKIVNQDGSTELANVGADAVNVDYNDTTVKAELDKLNVTDNSLLNAQTNQGNILTNLQSQVLSLASGSPLVASSVSEMTDTSRVYVNTSDGYWYWHNGTAWVSGGVYQGTKIDDNKVGGNSLFHNIKESYLKYALKIGYYYQEGPIRLDTYGYSQPFQVVKNDVIRIKNGKGNLMAILDSNMNFIRKLESDGNTIQSYTISDDNACYVIFNVKLENISIYSASINNIELFNKYFLGWLNINSDNIQSLEDKTIIPQKLYDKLQYFLTPNEIYYANNQNITQVNNNYHRTELYKVKYDDVIKIKNACNDVAHLYDENLNFIKKINAGDTISDCQFTVNNNARFVGFNILNDNLNTFKIYINNVELPLISEKVTLDWLNNNFKINDIEDNSINYNKLNTKLPYFLTANEIYYTNNQNITQVNNNYHRTELYEVNQGDMVKVESACNDVAVLYDKNLNFIKKINAGDTSSVCQFAVEYNVRFVGFNILNDNLNTFKIYINNVELPLISEKVTLDWLNVDQTFNNYSGKNLIVFGDSIVRAAQDNFKGYASRIKELLNLKNAVNKGVDGACIAYTDDSRANVYDIVSNTDLSNYDYVIISAGTNDFGVGSGVALGDLGDRQSSNFDETTFYGNFRRIIDYIYSQKQNVKIIILTPPKRFLYGNKFYDTINGKGLVLKDYVDALKKIGELYAIPIIDQFNNVGLNHLTQNLYTYDGLHYNSTGYDLASNYIASQLRCL